MGVSPPSPPNVIDRVRLCLRTRHYSSRTEKAYLAWVRRFVVFHHQRHPDEMGEAEVASYLQFLAVVRGVSASTQNQAFSALVFLYRDVLGRDLAGLEDTPRARRPERLPLVLAREEVLVVLQRLRGTPRLMCALMYGAGLRLLECCRLRVCDVDFECGRVVVRRGKGAKDRLTPLPARIVPGLREHLDSLRADVEADFRRGVFARAADVRTVAEAWSLAWLFPSPRLRVDRGRGVLWRPHLHPTGVQREIAAAARAAGIAKPATCHTLRHSFAVCMLESGVDIRTLQELMGHADVGTTLL
jgi:integron integrase